MEKGVLYAVFNSDEHLAECRYSNYTLKKFNPSIPTYLITDKRDFRDIAFEYITYLDLNENPLKLKIRALLESPFEKTLFLDADTEVIAPISELFDHLDNNNFVIANAPFVDFDTIPPTFLDYVKTGMYNTGMFLYDNRSNTKLLLKKWYNGLKNHDDNDMWPGHFCDQCYFNSNLVQDSKLLSEFESNLKVIDNKIYNVRPWALTRLIHEGKEDRIKILHTRGLHKNNCQSIIENLRKKH